MNLWMNDFETYANNTLQYAVMNSPITMKNFGERRGI